ncbi:MAG: molybdopterin-dependent oxidoreductase [Pseudomonadales bacterium]|nr:molybdopterin-dependent oxidoreductase [Pseudomonadales bacterium]
MSEEAVVSTHYRACHLCEALCGVEIKVENGSIVSIKGDKNDPLSEGYICPKATALQDIHEDPDRLRNPVKRVGDQWQEISWDDALDLVAKKLVETKNAHGANGVGAYFGNPSIHNWGMVTHAPNLFKLLKTKNRFSATSVDQLPHQLVAYWMYGHQLMVPVPDIDRSDFIVIAGGNPMASNGSLWTVPGFRHRAKALQQRGGKIVVLDPRYTETAEVADEHHYVKPGTDAWLLFALINVIFTEGLTDLGRLSDMTEGLDHIKTLVQQFTPEKAEAETGMSAGAITQLARDFASAERAVFYGRMGLSTQEYGSLCQWAIQLLNIITGNLDKVGGSMFSLPALDPIKGMASKPGHYGAWKSRVRGLPEFSGELPCSALAEEILTPGDGQIKMLITGAGNPVLSTPNGVQLEEALASLDFMVSVDLYINETTRFADVILPPVSPLEHDHYDLALIIFAIRNVAKYSAAVFDKPENALHDWEIFSALGDRVASRMDVSPVPTFLPEQILEMGLQSGPYGAMSKGYESQGGKSNVGLSLAMLKQHPEGVDLGTHEPLLPARLCTDNQMICLAPKELVEDLQRLQESIQEEENDNSPFLLIGRRHVRSNNSWMHNSLRLVKGKPRHQLMLNTQDAVALGVVNDDQVDVVSRVGSVKVMVEVTDNIMPGVVSLPHGWGHHRKGVKLAIAQEHAGVSANDLTDELFLDQLSGNAALSGVPVAVKPCK